MSDTSQQKIQIKPVLAPDALKGFYANNVELTLQKEEVIMDFYNVNARTRTAFLGSRIFMNPQHAQRIHDALGKLLKSHNQEGGPAKPTSEQTGEIGFNTDN